MRVKIRFFKKLDAFFREKVRNAYIILVGKQASKIPQEICGISTRDMWNFT
jgi:hypothetical protein